MDERNTKLLSSSLTAHWSHSHGHLWTDSSHGHLWTGSSHGHLWIVSYFYRGWDWWVCQTRRMICANYSIQWIFCATTVFKKCSVKPQYSICTWHWPSLQINEDWWGLVEGSVSTEQISTCGGTIYSLLKSLGMNIEMKRMFWKWKLTQILISLSEVY